MNGRQTFRCAVYTRKSTEEGLDQDFNSLDAQREACEAYIRSQTHEGWTLVCRRFDDGGYSGGSMERPALQDLLTAIRERQVDVVVVYKIDRLTRSLTDFSRIVEVFEAQGVSFVSVTQAFNTTSSMGRLTLNVLLSFAQFEREVTAERIRDKIAASKRKGMWMGGPLPLGYEVRDRKLVINEAEAEVVRTLFRLYLELGSVSLVQERAVELGLVTKRRRSTSDVQTGGVAFSRGHLYALLGNPLYIGRVAHRGETHPGRHDAIIDQATWDDVQARLADNRNGPGARRGAEPSLLTGLVFDETGDRLSPSHAIKAGRRYRYYVSHRLMQAPRRDGSGRRLPARELERIVVATLASLLRDPARLVDELRLDGLRPDQLHSVLRAAEALAGRIPGLDQAGLGTLLRRVIRRIDLTPGEITLRLDRSGLLASLSVGPVPVVNDDDGIAAEIVTAVPFRLRRRGVEARIVIGRADVSAAPDPTLIDLIGTAHRALLLLSTGRAPSVNEVALSLGLDASDVTRILPLAFLAPDITTAIFDGCQPMSLTANRLRNLTPIPADWVEQRHLLGFPHGASGVGD